MSDSLREWKGRLAPLQQKCQVLDVEDAEGFVKACIKRTKLRVDKDSYEDLVAAGLLILVEMSKRYDPERDQGPKAGFAGYAWFLLPRKLISAWHSMNENHMLRTQPDGTRQWEYYEKPQSWDALTRPAGTGSTRVDRGQSLDERKVRHVGDFIPIPRELANGADD